MRQGLGVTFLYRRGAGEMAKFVKYSYYFLTLFPFLLFHIKMRPENQMSEAIIKPLNLGQSHHLAALVPYYKFGLGFFILGVLFIYSYLILKKQTKGLLAMGFFALVYVFAFILSKNEFQSYLVLIFSHAIPYFWLMEKRLVTSHSSGSMKKFAVIFLFLIFLIGGLIDYNHQNLLDLFDSVNLLVLSLLYVPLIAHFLFDGVIWTRENERFQIFLKS